MPRVRDTDTDTDTDTRDCAVSLSMRFNLATTDEAGLVAGSTWVAVASSANTLRVFSLSGIMIGLISLPGPSVCLCDLDDNTVVIAYHRAPPIGNSQCISLLSYNVKTRSVPPARHLCHHHQHSTHAAS